MKSLYSIFFIILLMNCSTKYDDLGKQNDATTLYDIQVNYIDEESKPNFVDKHIQEDSLYLFFESRFKNAKMDIYLNGTQEITDTLETSAVLGLAEAYILGPMQEIKSIGIRIDDGRLMLIEPFEGQNIWRINYKKRVLSAQYTAHSPMYD